MSSESNPTQNWTWEKARHLLFRSGFGGKPSEIEKIHSLGLEAALDQILDGPTRSLPEPDWLEESRKLDPKSIRTMSREEQMELQKKGRQQIRELQAGWMKYMMSSPTPSDMLHEKMSFFWHGHFASSAQKVKAPVFIFDQLKLFHEQALGSFQQLLLAIIRDPAMLVYLDNTQNRKGKPNENLAREIMELFSLGTGNYTEQDIREGARALTGWGVDSWKFAFRERQHDAGEKRIFNQTGNFSGDDFVRLILEQPACAKFMCRKLWTFFASEQMDPTVLDVLADGFRKSGYQIKPLLRALFSHPAFYSPAVMGSQFRSPVQLVVGTVRTLELSSSSPEFFGRMLLMMGQVPYLPPNVKGWPGGREWIDTSRLVTRYSFASVIGNGRVPGEIDPRLQGDMDFSTPSGAKSKDEKKNQPQKKTMMLPRNLKTSINTKALVGSLDDSGEIVKRLTAILLPPPPSDDEIDLLVENHRHYTHQNNGTDPVQRLTGDIMMLPSYQLC